MSTHEFDAPPRFRKLAGTPEGQALWAALNEPENIIRAMTAADLGHPARERVGEELTRRFPDLVALPGTASWPWRQLAGAMLKQILLSSGYTMLKEKPVRRGGAFRNGMCYRRIAQ